MPFADKLSGTTGVGGCGWPISDRAIHIEFDFCNFSKNPPTSTFVTDAMTIRMM